MADPARYDVFIDGVKDASPAGRERLAQALASHYGLPLEQSRRVVVGGRFRVKRDVDVTLGRRYVSHLEALGARAALVEAGAAGAAPRPSGPRAVVGVAGTPAAPSAAPPTAEPPPARAAPAAGPAPARAPAAARPATPSPDDGIRIGALPAADAAPAAEPSPPAAGDGMSVVALDGAPEGAMQLERDAAPDVGGVELDPFLPPDAQEEDRLELDRPTRPARPAPPPEEPLLAPAAGAFVEEEPPPPAAPPRPAPPSAPRPGASAARPTAAAGAPAVPGLLFGGRLRQQLAARLFAGVVLCVGLSFIPAGIYAGHVQSATIRPLQQEERELREKPPRSETLRTPAVVRQEIGSARTKAFVLTLVIWLAGCGLLSFLWLRFT